MIALNGELYKDWFINVDSLVFEKIRPHIFIFHHTYIHPFHDEILTAILILFCTWFLVV